MKAIVRSRYGSTRVLKLKEVEKPVPGSDEVLVKVYASSVNSWDWDLLRGKPRIYRLMFGFFKPKHLILGCDIAGKVEVIGDKCQRFKPGDEVYADTSAHGFGAFAEYVCVPESMVEFRPSTISLAESASLPQAAVLALQGLQRGNLHTGMKVAINGAGGCCGPIAIQIAKIYDTEITAIDRAEKIEFLENLGADIVVDFKKSNFLKKKGKYDLILDFMARRSMFEYMRSLAPGGSLVIAGGKIRTILSTLLMGSILTFFCRLFCGINGKKFLILVHEPSHKVLESVKTLVDSGKVKPVIDSYYTLEHTAEALKYFGRSKHKGKIVISINA